MPVVEPHRLANLLGHIPTQLDILKLPLPSERPYQCLPERGLKKIFGLHMQREVRNPLFGIPALDSFVDGFLDCHPRIPWPHSQEIFVGPPRMRHGWTK